MILRLIANLPVSLPDGKDPTCWQRTAANLRVRTDSYWHTQINPLQLDLRTVNQIHTLGHQDAEMAAGHAPCQRDGAHAQLARHPLTHFQQRRMLPGPERQSFGFYYPGGGGYSLPYFSPMARILSMSSGPGGGGGKDGSNTGSPTSSKNPSNPAGVISTIILLGDAPTFLKPCRIFLGP